MSDGFVWVWGVGVCEVWVLLSWVLLLTAVP